MTHSECYRTTISRDEHGRISSIEVIATNLDGKIRAIQVNGNRVAQITGPVQEVLRGANVRGRQWTSTKPFDLAPGPGAHLELLLRAVKPLRRIDRVATVADGVAGMSREESAYWHAQTFRRRGLQALRVLVDGGSK